MSEPQTKKARDLKAGDRTAWFTVLEDAKPAESEKLILLGIVDVPIRHPDGGVTVRTFHEGYEVDVVREQ